MRDDWVTILPAAEEVKQAARTLLALARSPHDVRTAGTGTEFRVPPYLADLYSKPAPRRRRPKDVEQAPEPEKEGEE